MTQPGRIVGDLPKQTRPVADMRRDAEPLNVAPQQTLKGLSGEFVFFTPALLLEGGFGRDPVTEYSRVVDSQLSEWLLVFDFDTLLFPELRTHRLVNDGGVDVIDYRRRLYAAPHEKWTPLREFIAQLTWYRLSPKLYGKSAYNTVMIADPCASLSTIAQDVEIVSFVAETNNGTVFLRNVQNVLHPCVGFLPPDPQLIQIADILCSTEPTK